MKVIEYQIVINRPLLEVLACFEDESRVEGVQIDMPAGGYRFEVINNGTRVTLIGDPTRDPVNMIADSLINRVFKNMAAQPVMRQSYDSFEP